MSPASYRPALRCVVTLFAPILGAYRRGMTEPTEPLDEPAARTAGEEDHSDPDAFRADDDAEAPQNPETDSQGS